MVKRINEVNKMKLNELVEKASEEIKTEQEQQAIAMVKQSLKDIASAKRTLKALEKRHAELLETDVEDLETEDYDY